MIEVSKLEKSYGPIRALNGVSFEVSRGEIVGLLGHNGAGKTTVMKIMTGFLEPSGGSVKIGGADVLADPLIAQEQIGYLPENAPVYPEMLVQEYLLMIAQLRGIPESEINSAVARAVTETGLGDRLLQPIATLSKGYRQRVGLAQAIVHRPRVLILDEPTSGLDPTQIIEIRELIQRLAADCTVVLSTHILQEVEAVCGRAIILINGEIAADDSLGNLLSGGSVRLSVDAGGGDVRSGLEKLAEVVSVRPAGKDPGAAGFEVFEVEAEGADAGAAIGRLARDSGWTIGGLARDTHNLESVFNRLMADHIERASRRSA